MSTIANKNRPTLHDIRECPAPDLERETMNSGLPKEPKLRAVAKPDSTVAVGLSGTWLLVVITGGILYLCWIMVGPFASALTWAFALCVVLNPLRRRLIRKLEKTAVAVIMLTLVLGIAA